MGVWSWQDRAHASKRRSLMAVERMPKMWELVEAQTIDIGNRARELAATTCTKSRGVQWKFAARAGRAESTVNISRYLSS